MSTLKAYSNTHPLPRLLLMALLLAAVPAWAQKGIIFHPDGMMRRTPPHGRLALCPEPTLPEVKAPLPAPDAVETRSVTPYVNRLTADQPAHRAAAGIIISGRGSEVRAMSPFNTNRERTDAYAAVCNRYKEVFGADVRIYCMPIPIAVAYYCPDAAKDWTGSCAKAINGIFSALREDVVAVDVYTTLARHAAEPIYSRTDHHWSPLGAYYAAERFAGLAGVPFRDLSAYESDTVRAFVGTMYKFSKDAAVKQAPEDFIFYRPLGVTYDATFTEYALDRSRKRVVSEKAPAGGSFFRHFDDGSGAAYSTFMGGDAKLTRVVTSTPSQRRLLILKDSFGNALPGYLFYSFGEVHVVDCRYFTQNLRHYVADHGITDILFANNLQHACTPATTEMYLHYLNQ